MARLLNFLVAEDDDNDRFFLSRAFEDAHVQVALIFVGDGDQVVEYLTGNGKFADRTSFPYPDLLLLDLKMPRVDGFEVLEWMRAQTHSRCTPVIVISGSNRHEDLRRAFELGANSYLLKPCSSARLTEIARSIDSYWGQHHQFLQPPLP